MLDAMLARHRLTVFEARDPFAHVVGEVGLAELAVVDDVDAAGDLFADHRRDVASQHVA